MTDRQYFLLRRLHSLLGVFPLGIFLVEHLITNSMAMLGDRFFESKIALFQILGPALPLVEAVFIFIPLVLHITIGIYIALQSRTESQLSYRRNSAYKLQRITGWIALVYIAVHTIHLRFVHDVGSVPFSMELAGMFYGPSGFFWVPVYLIGGASVIFHFANGLCTFCMSWGITIGKESQRYMSYAGIGVGLALFLLLVSSVVGFMRMGPLAENPEYVAELVEYRDSLH